MDALRSRSDLSPPMMKRTLAISGLNPKDGGGEKRVQSVII